VRGGTNRSDFGEQSEAIFMTSGFRYDTAETAERRFTGAEQGFTYSRLGNPTVAMFEDRMALLEGAPIARATASGMAAVAASLLCPGEATLRRFRRVIAEARGHEDGFALLAKVGTVGAAAHGTGLGAPLGGDVAFCPSCHATLPLAASDGGPKSRSGQGLEATRPFSGFLRGRKPTGSNSTGFFD